MPDPPVHQDLLVVLITFPSQDEARRIAGALVEEHLAACVNLVPGVRSLFIWEGARQDETEVLAVVKTSRARFDRLAARVKSLHSYSTPEIIGLPIVTGSAPYLDWVADAVSDPINH
ncbi:MAG: divalent-cation tolerance protein CutA [Nitrospirota bacterium]